MEIVSVGKNWTLVQSGRSQVTIRAKETIWLTYHPLFPHPRKNLVSIKLPARSKATFSGRSRSEGIWIRTEGRPSRVEVTRKDLI